MTALGQRSYLSLPSLFIWLWLWLVVAATSLPSQTMPFCPFCPLILTSFSRQSSAKPPRQWNLPRDAVYPLLRSPYPRCNGHGLAGGLPGLWRDSRYVVLHSTTLPPQSHIVSASVGHSSRTSVDVWSPSILLTSPLYASHPPPPSPQAWATAWLRPCARSEPRLFSTAPLAAPGAA